MTKPSTNFFNKEVSGNSLEKARFCSSGPYFPGPSTSKPQEVSYHISHFVDKGRTHQGGLAEPAEALFWKRHLNWL